MREKARAVLDLFAAADAAIGALKASTGLACPAGCGRCCTSPQVEATVLEMLPMALELLARGDAPFWLERARHAAAGPCIAFEPDPVVPGNGRCALYSLRPPLCRLFGFAALRNKHGAPELVVCHVAKEATAETAAAARRAVARGTAAAPFFSDLAHALSAIDPDIGVRRLPINEALQRALEKAGLHLALAEPPAPPPSDALPPEPPDARPPRPLAA